MTCPTCNDSGIIGSITSGSVGMTRVACPDPCHTETASPARPDDFATESAVPHTPPRTSQGEAASGLGDASIYSRSVESWGDGGGGPGECSAPDRASSQTRETSSEPLVNREQSPIGALIKPPYTTDPSRLAKAENGFVPKMDLALPLPPQFHWCRDCGAMVERCCHECSEDE